MTYEVAIVGAGLSGLTLALALHQMGITATVYESRATPLNIGGAVMLSPNALKVLDVLDLYQDVREKGYSFDISWFRNVAGEILETYEFGGKEKYGYDGNRIYRSELIGIVLAKVRSAGVAVKFGHKVSHVVEETDDHVTWQFTDGTASTASLLVGADGIHSTVRKYLYPDLAPRFTGMAGITSAIPASRIPSHLGPIKGPVTVLSKEKGAFVIAPQKADGSELLIGKQKHMTEQTREGWEKVHADKAAAVAFLQENADAFGDIAIAATQQIPLDKVNIWPFYVIPKLDKWASEKRRVVILGDSAHAIPPSAGQGINQAFEDVYIFALLLAESQQGRVELHEALSFWQQYRQGRVDKVLELNKQIDMRRMPQGNLTQVDSGRDGPVEQKAFDLAWLYEPDFKKDVKDWVASRGLVVVLLPSMA